MISTPKMPFVLIIYVQTFNFFWEKYDIKVILVGFSNEFGWFFGDQKERIQWLPLGAKIITILRLNSDQFHVSVVSPPPEKSCICLWWNMWILRVFKEWVTWLTSIKTRYRCVCNLILNIEKCYNDHFLPEYDTFDTFGKVLKKSYFISLKGFVLSRIFPSTLFTPPWTNPVSHLIIESFGS